MSSITSEFGGFYISSWNKIGFFGLPSFQLLPKDTPCLSVVHKKRPFLRNMITVQGVTIYWVPRHPDGCFICFSFICRLVLWAHFTDEEAEAWKGCVIEPKSHSWLVTGLKFGSKSVLIYSFSLFHSSVMPGREFAFWTLPLNILVIWRKIG